MREVWGQVLFYKVTEWILELGARLWTNDTALDTPLHIGFRFPQPPRFGGWSVSIYFQNHDKAELAGGDQGAHVKLRSPSIG